MLIARSLTRAFFSSENTACAIAPLPNVYEKHTDESKKGDNVHSELLGKFKVVTV